MEADGISWLPTIAQAQIDEEQRRAVLFNPRGKLAFGAIPGGWTIEVHGAGNRVGSISADRVGRDVKLLLVDQGPLSTSIGSAFRSVAIRPRTSNVHVHLIINRTGTKFILTPGLYEINGDRREYVVDVGQHTDSHCLLTGTARLRAVHGSLSTLSISGGLTTQPDLSSYSGKVIFPQLRETTLSAPGLTTTVQGSISNSTVDVEALEVGGSIEDSSVRTGALLADSLKNVVLHCNGSTNIRGSVDGSHVQVNGGRLFIGTVRETATTWDRWRGAAPWTARSTISSASGSVFVGPVEDVTITAGDEVWIHGDARTSDAAERKTVSTKGTLYVSGSLSDVDVDVAHAIVHQDLARSELRAQRVHVEGTVADATIRANDVQVDGAVDARASIALSGDAQFNGPVGGTVSWEAQPGAVLAALKGLGTLTVGSQGHQHNPPAIRTQSIESLSIDGLVAIEPHAGALIGSLILTARAVLLVRSNDSVEIDQAVHAESGARLGFEALDSASTLAATVGDATKLELASDGRVLFRGHNEASIKAELELSGVGTFQFDCEVGSVCCRSTGSDWFPTGLDIAEQIPTLDVSRAGAILSLEGDVRLGSVAGRISGQPDAGNAPGTSRPAARLRGVNTQSEALGVVTGVDPTPLPYSHLDRLEELHVFEPDGQALIAYAKHGPNDRFDAQARAQKMQRLADLVSKRAVSGSARSSARWAAARTHHAAVQKPIENLMRWGHRGLGYSQRPAPALATWLAISSYWAILLGGCVPSCWGPFPNDLLSVLFVPGSLFRVPAQDTTQLLFDSVRLHTFVFLTTSVPLAFLVIAIRNFMSQPHDRGN